MLYRNGIFRSFSHAQSSDIQEGCAHKNLSASFTSHSLLLKLLVFLPPLSSFPFFHLSPSLPPPIPPSIPLLLSHPSNYRDGVCALFPYCSNTSCVFLVFAVCQLVFSAPLGVTGRPSLTCHEKEREREEEEGQSSCNRL